MIQSNSLLISIQLYFISLLNILTHLSGSVIISWFGPIACWYIEYLGLGKNPVCLKLKSFRKDTIQYCHNDNLLRRELGLNIY